MVAPRTHGRLWPSCTVNSPCQVPRIRHGVQAIRRAPSREPRSPRRASPHSPRVILLGKTLSAVIIGAAQALIVLVVAAAIPAIHFEWQYGIVISIGLSVFAIVVLNLFLSGLGQLLASRIHTMQGFHLVMNLVLCVVLVPRFGGHGAAAATSISLAFETVLLFWIVRRRLGLHVLAFGKR